MTLQLPDFSLVFVLFALISSSSLVAQQSGAWHEIGAQADSLRRADEHRQAISLYQSAMDLMKADSLREQRLLFLLRQGLSYSLIGEGDSALVRYKSVAHQLEASADTTIDLYGHALLNAGVVFRQHGQQEKALTMYRKSGQAYIYSGNGLMQSTAAMNTALIQKERGNYKEALAMFHGAADNFESEGDSLRLAEVFGQLGTIQMRLGDFSKAKKYQQQSLGLSDLLEDAHASGSAHNNLGTLFFQTGELDSAIYHFTQATQLFSLVDGDNLGKTQHNLAKVYQAKGDYNKARSKYQEAIVTKQQQADSVGLALSLAELAGLLVTLEQYPEAWRRITQAEVVCSTRDSDEAMASILSAKKDYYIARNELDSALISLEAYASLQRARSRKEYVEEVAMLQERFEADQREQRILSLHDEVESTSLDLLRARTVAETLEKRLFMALGVVVGISAFFVGFQYYRRKKAQIALLQAKISGQEDEKTRVARELHDAASSDIRSLRMLIQEMRVNAPKESTVHWQEIDSKLSRLGTDIVSISHQLYRPDFLRAGFKTILADLVMDLSERTAIDFSLDIDEAAELDALSDEVRTHLYRIAQEALSNAIKHSEATRVALSVSTDDSHARMGISDNGRGVPTEQLSRGIGLRTMADRSKSIGGRLLILDGPGGQGTTVEVSVPLKYKKGDE